MLGLTATCLFAGSASAKLFPNCRAVNKVYTHGIAWNFKVIKTANGLTGRPFVSAKQYAANRTRDRDKDGVACET
jgi:Excalibur calcium-binding domain